VELSLTLAWWSSLFLISLLSRSRCITRSWLQWCSLLEACKTVLAPRYQRNTNIGSACFVTIIRLTKVITVDLLDPTWGTVDLMIWTGMEVYRYMLQLRYIVHVINLSSAVICCCLPTMRPVIKFVWKRCGLKNLSSSGNTDDSKQASTTDRIWSRRSRQNSRHQQDTILSNGNADELELTKCAYYELHSDNHAHTSWQTSITEHVHQQV
jgi:hypothetical protein